ncbi:hypothetical protein BDV19DRAFT_369419 [Aspergillus venezuelensis]
MSGDSRNIQFRYCSYSFRSQGPKLPSLGSWGMSREPWIGGQLRGEGKTLGF